MMEEWVIPILIMVGAAAIGASFEHFVAAVFIMKTPPFGLPWKVKNPVISPLAVAQATGAADLRRINAERLRDQPVDEDNMLRFEDGWIVVDGDEEDEDY